MRRFRTGSALLALIVLTATADGQPPAKVVPPEPMPKKADPKPVNPADALIAGALANDPDIKVAQAKVQLAEAELAKARLAVTLKVTALASAVEQHRATLEVVQKRFAASEQQFKAGLEPQSAYLDARLALAREQAALASAEMELKLLTAAGNDSSAKSVELGLRWLSRHQALTGAGADDYASVLSAYLAAHNQRAPVKGPVPDRLRDALDKTVKIGPKGTEVPFPQAMETIKKETGLDISVRGTYAVPSIVSQGEELPVGAWLQLFQDVSGGMFYVREYGLLVADRKAAPPDAPTLTEFWKQKPPATKPDPKPEPAPEPKPK